MNEVYEKLQGCLKSVREKTDFKPEIALVLGSGLGEYAEEIGADYYTRDAIELRDFLNKNLSKILKEI